MAIENGIIKAPISLDEIYEQLGLSPGDYGYDLGYACKNTHGKINPDSKDKPMEVNTVSTLSIEQKQKAFYGFNIPTSTNADNNLNFATSPLGDWEYVPPNTWKRATDFLGYDHNATITKGDWGLYSVYLAGSSTTTGFISKIINSDVKENIGNGIGVKMRAENPDKPTTVCPKDIPQLGYLGYFVYKAPPDTLPSWRLVQVRIDQNPVNVTSGHSGIIRFSDLDITNDNIDDGIEMYVRIVGVCFKTYHTDLTSTVQKSSLNYNNIKQIHDVMITSGAYLSLNQVQWQRTMWNNKDSIALHGNAYVLPSYPTGAPIKAYLGANIRVYSQSGVLLTTLSRTITYSSQDVPVVNTIANVRKEFYIEDLPYNWYKLEGEFSDLNGGNRYVKCDTYSVTKPDLGL